VTSYFFVRVTSNCNALLFEVTSPALMMGEMSLDDWDEKTEKKNDQDEVDGMRQEVYSRGEEMHNEMSDLF